MRVRKPPSKKTEQGPRQAALPGVHPEGVLEFARWLWAQAHEPGIEAFLSACPIDSARDAREVRKLRYRMRKLDPEGWKFFLAFRKECRTGRLRRPPGRPKRAKLWGTVWLLRTTFVILTRRPQWCLIADLLNGVDERRWTAATVRARWAERAADFTKDNAETFLWYKCSHAARLMRDNGAWGSPALRAFIAHLLGALDERHKVRTDRLQNLVYYAREAALENGVPPDMLDELERTLRACTPEDLLDRGPVLDESKREAQELVDTVVRARGLMRGA